ncbi:hypothetical protein OUZ56_030050 [Daphnia magna]|uniref:Uncharacterized protein n=1 Tax=Daphnia magna TaxID=35525 RepID=A0ABQ9ZQ55_9CRUS|nr:hypothetical protein OUZ56_030050 [Daphnia magna]
MDSITFPKTFVSLPNLEDTIRMLIEFISEKTDVALNWPKHSASGDDPSIQSEPKAGPVISFSEDIKVLELTRDAMLKPKTKSAQSTKILHSTPKSQVAPKAVASVPYAKKSLPPVFRNTSNSEHIQQSKRKTTQTNQAGSKYQSVKPTADSVSDLGVSALVSSESEESNSGNEEGDWLDPSPPSRPLKKVPRSDVCLKKYVCRNGLILTPPGSRCNTPSSFRTPSSEDENSQAQIIEQSNSLQELEEENSFFKEQLNQSLIDYEDMKAEYERELVEKDELKKSLREQNPLVLAQTLRESVLLLDTALANLPSNSRQSVAVSAANSAAPSRSMVKLHEDYTTIIDPSALKLAMSYGKSGNTTKEMGKMVATIMEAFWD